jgi:hypothetical protein
METQTRIDYGIQPGNTSYANQASLSLSPSSAPHFSNMYLQYHPRIHVYVVQVATLRFSELNCL